MKQEPVAYRVWCDCGDSIEPNTNAICGNCVASMNTEPQYSELTAIEVMQQTHNRISEAHKREFNKPQYSELTQEEIDHSWFNHGEGEISKEALNAFVNSILKKARGEE